MLATALRSAERVLSTMPVRLGGYILHQVRSNGGIKMRDKPLSLVLIVLAFAIFSLAGCVVHSDVSGLWKGTIQASGPGGKDKWQGPAELTLNQNGDALTGTLVFTHPQGGRVQVPITSGIVSKDSVTFSGQNQFPMGSLEITFHGRVSGASLTGTADMTSRSVLIGPQANTASLNLTKP
jgi:hypothetical protein